MAKKDAGGTTYVRSGKGYARDQAPQPGNVKLPADPAARRALNSAVNAQWESKRRPHK
jgi:hypothetical protein